MDILKENITALRGIGQKRADLFRTLGLYKTEDLLYYYPRTYEDRTVEKKIAETVEGESVCIRARAVTPLKESRPRRNMTVTTLKVSDGTAFLELVWFNNRFIKNMLSLDREYIFYGKITLSGKLQMYNPLFELPDTDNLTGRILPVYSLCAGLTSKIVNDTVWQVLEQTADFLPETLPDWVLKTYCLCSKSYAIRNIHFPKDSEALEIARRRLAFEELFTFQSALMYLRGNRTDAVSTPFPDTSCISEFIRTLPFPLTGAQNRVIQEICLDLEKSTPMSRLVQGDVGCGKTMIAACAMFVCARNGFTSAMMAPTEILANQHYESLSSLFAPFGMQVRLITGSMTAKARREVTEEIENGKVQIIVGTHALISDKTILGNPALIITDEQHRFGVSQRKSLQDKGTHPHTLVMTATPIPRTLALILYGDLDISVIDELPPGRQKIDTFVLGEHMRERIHAFIQKETDAGRQVYVVCPAVEPSEIPGIKDVTTHTKYMQDLFGKENVTMLHGKMKPAEKDEIMRAFKDGAIQILVATSVIEVGVNVPNASVMIIENAARFGLAQLHQLRGRVGRGSNKAYCILFPGENVSPDSPRMATMKNNSDGFKIAETDLKLRGPGEFFGARQSGFMPFKIANIFCDTELLVETTACTKQLLSSDPELERAENRPIFDAILRLFDTNVTFS